MALERAKWHQLQDHPIEKVVESVERYVEINKGEESKNVAKRYRRARRAFLKGLGFMKRQHRTLKERMNWIPSSSFRW